MDYEKLFAIEGNFLAPKSGARIPWERITAEEKALLLAMGERVWRMVGDLQKVAKRPELMRVPAPTWAAAEIGVAHLCRDMDLRAMSAADDGTFFAEYLEIIKHINRALGFVSSDARLRFARK